MKYSDVLKGKQAESLNKANAIYELASKESREMTADEQTAFDATMTEHAGYEAKITVAIENEKKLAVKSAPQQRRTVDAPVSSASHDNLLDDPMCGFKNTREYLGSVVQAGYGAKNGVRADERLMIMSAAPSTFGGEGTGADGGFAAPPTISKEIWSLSLTDDNLIQYCDNTPIEGNAITFPSDEETPWGTGGPRGYWANEALEILGCS